MFFQFKTHDKFNFDFGNMSTSIIKYLLNSRNKSTSIIKVFDFKTNAISILKCVHDTAVEATGRGAAPGDGVSQVATRGGHAHPFGLQYKTSLTVGRRAMVVSTRVQRNHGRCR